MVTGVWWGRPFLVPIDVTDGRYAQKSTLSIAFYEARVQTHTGCYTAVDFAIYCVRYLVKSVLESIFVIAVVCSHHSPPTFPARCLLTYFVHACLHILRPQMRFMKYVYKHVNEQKAAKAHARLQTQIAGADRSDKRRTPNSRSGRGAKLARNANLSIPEEPIKATPNFQRGRVPRDTSKSKTGERGARGPALRDATSKQRLLEEKRGILFELRGVVSRQAEALDRLVESCGNTCAIDNRGKSDAAGGRGGDGRNNTFAQGDNGCRLHRRSQSASSGCRRAAPQRAKPHSTISIATSGRNAVARARSTASSVTTSNTSLSSLSSRGKVTLPARPPENATSTFLALGGQWGGETRTGALSHDSAASSASYATYCEPRRLQGDTARRIGRRPGVVPALPIGVR